MKSILLLILTTCLISTAFSQEEIWGLNSFFGNEGGGIIYKIDFENDTTIPVHRFGFSFEWDGILEPYFLNENDKLYGTIKIKPFGQWLYYDGALIEYDMLSGEYEYLDTVPPDSRVCYVDQDAIYLCDTRADQNNSTYIYKYSRQSQEISLIAYFDKTFGYNVSGNWTKYNGAFYFMLTNGGSYQAGTLLKFAPETNLVSKLFDFRVLKQPQGNIIVKENQFIGITRTGIELTRGAIFKIDPQGSGFEVINEFTTETGALPTGKMCKVSDYEYYGLTIVQGALGKGTIFRYNTIDNSITPVHYFNPESEYWSGHKLGENLCYDGHSKIYFNIEKVDEASSMNGYLLSYDIFTGELNLEIDFSQQNFNNPKGYLNCYNNEIYGVVKNSNTNPVGSIYKFSPENSQIELVNSLIINTPEENGQTPYWLCQATDGNIYGQTLKGGKNNEGIFFKIDYYTQEFTKLRDNLDLLSQTKGTGTKSAFFPSDDKIVYITYSLDYPLKKYHVYEYNIIGNVLTNPFDFNFGSWQYINFKQGTNGLIYFTADSLFYEYNPATHSLDSIQLPDDNPLVDIIEWKSGIYYGITTKDIGSNAESIFRWNRNTGQLDYLAGQERVSAVTQYGADHLIQGMFITSNEILLGRYRGFDSKSYWEGTYSYDIKSDSVSTRFNSVGEFIKISTKCLAESPDGRFIVYAHFLDGLNLLNTDSIENKEIAIEGSPYEISAGEEGYYITSAHYRVIPVVDLAPVTPPNNHWIGRIDSVWNNPMNWATTKMPESDEKIVISQFSKHFPYIDTVVEIADLYVVKNARITLGTNGTLTCNQLTNNGTIHMLGNDTHRASMKWAEVIDNGHLEYTCFSTDTIARILALPVETTIYNSLDSINVWTYQDGQWNLIADTAAILEYQKTYKFETDSIHPVVFKGELNTGSLSFPVSKSGLHPQPNPFAASLAWDRLSLPNLTHKALYRFNETDNCFSYYIDGLGNASALIRPLDVVFVHGEAGDMVDLADSQTIHEIDFQPDEDLQRKTLMIQSEGDNVPDYTFIGFNANASSGYDKSFDAIKMDTATDTHPILFTIADSLWLAINQIPDTSMIDLAFKALKNGNYTLSIGGNEGFDFVVLEDLIWHKKIDLLKENYSFDYFTTDGAYPFKLYFEPWVLEPLNESDVEMYFYPESIVVNSRKQIERAEIILFDLAGRAVEQFNPQNFFRFEQPVSLPTGHYILQLRSGEFVLNRKILVRR